MGAILNPITQCRPLVTQTLNKEERFTHIEPAKASDYEDPFRSNRRYHR